MKNMLLMLMLVSLTSCVHVPSYVGVDNPRTRSNLCQCNSRSKDEDSPACKLEEQTILLEEYTNKSYLYGRQAQDLQSHTIARINKIKKELKECN